MRKTPVLIVGGGPVGLAFAAELGWRGISCLLVEQTDGAIRTPKMNEVNIRTMEICRRWGIADQILNCPFPADFPLDVSFVTSLFGYEMGRVARPARKGQTPPQHSPYWLQACSQIWFDPMLRDFACTFPHVELRYRWRLEDFRQTEKGVEAIIVSRDDGMRETIATDYLVGCDGAGSMVREKLGIKLEGKGSIGNPVHLFFRAPDLLEQSGHRPATFFLLADKDGFWGNLRIIDPVNGIWRLMAEDSDGSLKPESIDREAYLKRAMGKSVKVEWLGASIWKRMSVVAEHYGKGRVFLAGDAVHQLSPTGALGMNTGIGDAVDLGWKLAAVFQGWGGKHLLSTYEMERKPVGERAVRMATSFYASAKNLAHDTGALIGEDSKAGAAAREILGEQLIRDVGREFRTIGLQIGYRYEKSPICVPDGSPATLDDPAEYAPSARPGSRAPHSWLDRDRSTLDLFGKGFVLLRFYGAPASSLHAAAERAKVPLEEIAIADDASARLYERNYVLVRPDGHVAWRGDAIPTDPKILIDTIRGAVSA